TPDPSGNPPPLAITNFAQEVITRALPKVASPHLTVLFMAVIGRQPSFAPTHQPTDTAQPMSICGTMSSRCSAHFDILVFMLLITARSVPNPRIFARIES